MWGLMATMMIMLLMILGVTKKLVELLHPVQDRLLARLLHLAREEELVEDHVHLVEVEDEVELAHVPEELVEQLDEEVDRLKVDELVVLRVDAQREEEAGVPAVDELVLPPLDEVGELRVARRHRPCVTAAADAASEPPSDDAQAQVRGLASTIPARATARTG